jgi:hypothetical protein
MKLAVPNLKTLDYKQLGIDHGEKLAIAIVGLILLGVLYATRWTHPIQQSPTELIDRATTADEKIKKQEWPQSDVKLFNTGDTLSTRATGLLSALESGPWALPVQMNKPYHPERTLISRPKWLAVTDLVATAQQVDLEMDPKVSPLKEGFQKLKKQDSSKSEKAKKGDKDKEKDKEAEEKKDDPFMDELKRNANPGGSGGLAPGGIGGFGGGFGGIGGGKNRGRGRVPNLGRGKGRKPKKGGDDDAPVAVATQKAPEKPVGRGYHVVAVRGIFPLREQVAELRRAMGNSVTAHDAQELIQMHDFILERQTAKPGPDPWSGPWEKVDRASTLEMFHNDVYSFEPEPVLDSIVDSHICMPLPVRLVGTWGKLASHAKVKEFVLSDDEVKQQLEYQRKVIEKLQQEKTRRDEKLDKNGFAEFTKNPRNVRRGAAAAGSDAENNKPIQDQIVDELQKAAKDRPTEAEINARLTDFITKHASPQDHLLLFRYIDFTVEPGKIYRYRVKLQVDNPFRNRHPEEVSDPSLIEGLTRDSDDWSVPSPPVYVPEDATFFLTQLAARPGHNTLPTATVDLYQWFASTGTIVNKVVKAQLGQVFGGLEKAKVIDPAQGTSEDERVPFSTGAALVDMARGFSLDAGLHKDLIAEMGTADTKDKSDPQDKKAADKKNTGTMVPDVLVFVDSNGTIRTIDTLDQEEEHQTAKRKYTVQNEQYEDLNKSDEEKPGRGRGRMGPGGKGRAKKGPKSPGGQAAQ